MLANRILHSPDEFRAFARLYWQHARGIRLAPEYLRQSTVRVFYTPSAPDCWLGGYVINQAAPLRYLHCLEPARQQAVLTGRDFRADDCVEIAGNWLDKEHIGLGGRAEVYTWMMMEAYATGRPVVLAGSFIRQNQALHRRVLPHLLYEAPVRIGTYSGHAQVYFGYRAGLLQRFFRTALADTLRRVFRRRSGTRPLPPIQQPLPPNRRPPRREVA
jgi:hypothetical protein